MARSLIPIYALAIILLGGVVYPVQVQREKQLVRRERLVFDGRQPGRAWPAEMRFIEQGKPGPVRLIDGVMKLQ